MEAKVFVDGDFDGAMAVLVLTDDLIDGPDWTALDEAAPLMAVLEALAKHLGIDGDDIDWVRGALFLEPETTLEASPEHAAQELERAVEKVMGCKATRVKGWQDL